MMPTELLASTSSNFSTPPSRLPDTPTARIAGAPPEFIFNTASTTWSAAHRALDHATAITLSTGCFTAHERLRLEPSTLRMDASHFTRRFQTTEPGQPSAPRPSGTTDACGDAELAQKAGELIRGGADIREAFKQLGIAFGPRTETIVYQLLREFGLPLVKEGMPVVHVRKQLGVQSGPVLSQFELDVLRELGMPRVRAGGSFRQVRDALGIPAGRAATAASRELLAELGLPRIANGEDWDAVTRSLGVDAWIRPIGPSAHLWSPWVPQEIPLDPSITGNAQLSAKPHSAG